jgi:hypothetical protein
VAIWAARQGKAQGEGEVACGWVWVWEKEAAKERRRGEAGRLKAKAQTVGPKTGDGPKLKKKFLLNFKLNLGIWLDFGNLHKEILEEI